MSGALSLFILLLVPSTALQAQSVLYWVEDSERLQRFDGESVETILFSHLRSPGSLSLDADAGHIYWQETGRIGRADLDDREVEIIVDLTEGATAPVLDALAIDYDGRRIYWGNYAAQTIQSAPLDGGDVVDVVANAQGPSCVAVLPEEEKLYWCQNSFAGGVIMRANLDGSDPEEVVGSVWMPRALVFDLSEEKMYWVDAVTNKVQRSNADGSDVEDLVEDLVNPTELALDVENGKMYWTDRLRTGRPGIIQRANLDGSEAEDLITDGIFNPIGIVVDHKRDRILWADEPDAGFVMTASTDGNNIEPLLEGLGSFASVVFDATSERLYWSDHRNGAVYSAELDGSERRRVVSDRGAFEVELVLNDTDGALYWLDPYREEIGYVPRDGGEATTLFQDLDYPSNLVVVDEAGKILWIGGHFSYPSTIYRANVDGSDYEEINPDGAVDIDFLTVGPPDGSIYWKNEDKEIRRAASDGSNVEQVARSTGFIHTFTLLPDRDQIYWTESRGVFRSALHGGAEEELLSNVRVRSAGKLIFDADIGRMYFTSTSPNEDAIIYAADPSGDNLEQLATTAGRPSDLTLVQTVGTDVDRLDATPQTALLPNYPNPFTHETTIRYSLGRPGAVRIFVFNTLGQRVIERRRGSMAAGAHNEVLNFSSHPSGLYMVSLEIDYGGGTVSRNARKLVHIK